MVEIRLLAGEYHAETKWEQEDWDHTVFEMVNNIGADLLKGCLNDSVDIRVSFYDTDVLRALTACLNRSGALALIEWEMGCTCVLHLRIDPDRAPLFTRQM
jgi:hypothetical protein